MGIISSVVALVVAALLVVGGLGGATVGSFMQTSAPHIAQAQAPAAGSFAQQSTSHTAQAQVSATTDPPEAQGQEAEELTTAADTDNVQVQEGDQSGPDDGVAMKEAGDGQDAAPTGTPAISVDAAKQAAEAYLNAGMATKVELDEENGRLVYGVEIGSADVKVDATSGSVIGTESGED